MSEGEEETQRLPRCIDNTRTGHGRVCEAGGSGRYRTEGPACAGLNAHGSVRPGLGVHMDGVKESGMCVQVVSKVPLYVKCVCLCV